MYGNECKWCMDKKLQPINNDWLDDKQYKALLMLYNEFNAAFNSLDGYIKDAFYARLYQKN